MPSSRSGGNGCAVSGAWFLARVCLKIPGEARPLRHYVAIWWVYNIHIYIYIWYDMIYDICIYINMYITRMNIIEHHYQGVTWEAKIMYWEYTIMEYVSNIVFGSLQTWWMQKKCPNAPSHLRQFSWRKWWRSKPWDFRVLIYVYIHIWVNYNDLTATEPWKS